ELDKNDGKPRHRVYYCSKGRRYEVRKKAHTLEERNKAHENNGCEYHIPIFKVGKVIIKCVFQSTVSIAQNVNPPLPTTSALPQSPTTLLAAFTTGPLTAPAATGSQPDYFSGSYHNSPTSPTGPSGNLTPPALTGSEPLGGQLSTP
ncbi:39319_t:CDS:2, partial [Gigaspora margarita]